MSELRGLGKWLLRWRKREPSQRKQEDEQLVKQIEDAYHNNRQVYGNPHVHAELKEQDKPLDGENLLWRSL